MSENGFLWPIFSGIRTELQFLSLRKKSPYSELFWSIFSRIRAEYGAPYLVWMWEIRTRITPNTDSFHAVCHYAGKYESKETHNLTCFTQCLINKPKPNSLSQEKKSLKYLVVHNLIERKLKNKHWTIKFAPSLLPFSNFRSCEVARF